MSRFFANVDEEEEEQKEELVPIKEETEKAVDEEKKGGKKKKKGKGDKPEGEAPPEAKEPAKEVKEEEEKEKDDKKKDKKKKGPAAEIQRKIEEQRRAQREKWSAVFLSVANDYHRQQIELNLEFFREHVRKTKADLKKQERKEKNLGMKDRKNWERQEEARQMMEQMLRENQKDLTQLTGPVANKRRKKPGQADPKAAEKEENKEDNEEKNKPEEGVKTEEAKKVSEDTKSEEKKGEAVDADLDWETQIEEVVPERKPSAASKAPAPAAVTAPVAAPVAAPKPQPPKKAPEPKADPEDPKNAKNKVQEIAKQIISREYEAFNVKSKYRCPIICIMGHVDTGKTKILDQIRQTNVQVNEAGGITQQIGASFFPQTKLKEQISKLDAKALKVGCEIPGLLVIDTPGHEAFANLRNRGSSLCDMAIVVVDIMHGLERQTIESLKMLHEKQTPYIIALNKIDRIYGWKQAKDTSSFVNLQKQASATKTNFEEKKLSTLTQLMKEGINSKFYWENSEPEEYVSIVPTSALIGEGMPDLLGYITYYTQAFLEKKILRNEVDFKATVLEVKKVEGIGMTVDVILVSGVLRINDTIVLSGFDGPIVTTVKGILTPHPMKEMRVKNEYISHEVAYGAMGLRLVATDLEKAIAGSAVFQLTDRAQLPEFADILSGDIKRVKKIVKTGDEGVGVAASTLGSLEALLVYLKEEKIPVSHVTIGDMTKTDMQKILAPFTAEDKKNRKKEYLTVLCFDVRILPDAAKFAEDNGIKIIKADIIYHLSRDFEKYVTGIQEARKREEGRKAIFPCQVKFVQVFHKKDPIIAGIEVLRGVVRPGTILCVPERDNLKIGVIETLEFNHKPLKEARKATGTVAVKIKGVEGVHLDRHFQDKDTFASLLSRESIDALKEHFRDEMTKDDWDLVRELKTVYGIK